MAEAGFFAAIARDLSGKGQVRLIAQRRYRFRPT